MNTKRREGLERQYWAIRAFLDGKGHTLASFARQVGVSREAVGKTVRGQANSARVLVALVDEGCPIEFLDLPDSMKMKAVA